jgi:hypothetical protein
MMEPCEMGPHCSWVVMNSPQPTSSEFGSHGSPNKTWLPLKFWGYLGEIIRQPHQRLKTSKQYQRLQHCIHQPSNSKHEHKKGSLIWKEHGGFQEC